MVEGHPIYAIDEPESAYNWLDILGMYFKIENYNTGYINPAMDVELDEVIFSNPTLSDRINIKMQYVSNDISLQPYFDYQLQFSTAPLDTANYVSPLNACDDFPEKTFSHTKKNFFLNN